VGYSVSATTRARREGEEDGVHYYFLSPEEFARREAAGEFVETATYGGQRYGTLRAEVDRLLASGRHVILDVEVRGAEQLRRAYPDSVHVFVLPPSGPVLVERLLGRRTEDRQDLQRRLQIAAEELGQVGQYDYVVVNDDLRTAVERVGAILEAESLRVSRQGTLDRVVDDLRRELLTWEHPSQVQLQQRRETE
jgi:guanylate kinase